MNCAAILRRIVIECEALPTRGRDDTGMTFLVGRADVIHVIRRALTGQQKRQRGRPRKPKGDAA